MGKETIRKHFDVVVVGGGISGVCAAIAGARHGAQVALVQNRPVLGGNASSEIRMHICGTDYHGSRANARETGILEEILLDTRLKNPTGGFTMLDVTLWEKVRFQKGLELYLNTHMDGVTTSTEGTIQHITAEQLTTETRYEFSADIFIDATGDGTLAALAGAEYATGREGKGVYGEQYAPDESDNITMGNTLMFKAIDTGSPVAYSKPLWANKYSEDELSYRGHSELSSGYWWVELGGDELDVIKDGETIRDELLKCVFGVWDHIKNGGAHNAENYALDWVGFLPGKRESRRILGDYVLKEQDCLEGRRFEDAVAYGGWPMDMHSVGGIKHRGEPTVYIHLPDVYTIPYRSLYSRNIYNLMLAGRSISASHMAFGSTRVMATCAVVGQAVGTAAAMAVCNDISPRDICGRIKQLQQTLLRDDCRIPGIVNRDTLDFARNAAIYASSQMPGCEAENIVNGITASSEKDKNLWVSEPMSSKGEWIELALSEVAEISTVYLKFDSNLSREIMVTLSDNVRSNQIPGVPPELVRDYHISFYRGDSVIDKKAFANNHQRFVKHEFDALLCDRIRVGITKTNGCSSARIFEIRLYGKKEI